MARPFARIGARSSRYVDAFILAVSGDLARSRQRSSKFANFQSPTQSSPQPSSQHCRTLSRRHRDSCRVVYRGALSQVEQSSHAPCTHSRNDYQSLRWPSSFTQRVYSKKNEQLLYCCTPVITHEFWVHIGPIPWATSNRQTSQLALR